MTRIRIWPRKRWVQIALGTVVVVFAPYLFSRAMSPWRQIREVVGEAAIPTTGRGGIGIRIVCYNIAHGRGTAESNWTAETAEERFERLDGIADLLAEMDADIVVLNEVDFDSSWSRSVNQAEYLAKTAGYPHRVEQRNVDFRFLFWTWRFGNAVLSKHPVTNAEVVDLPAHSGWEALLAGKKRSIACDIQFGDETVKVIAVHFSHRSEPVRADSSKLMVEIAEGSEVPVILAGDFNSTPPGFPRSVATDDGRNAIAMLDQSGRFLRMPMALTQQAGEFTFHSTEPRSVIDWVFIPAGWRFDWYEVVRSELSDHRPVLVEVSGKGGGEK